jgi:hypothetical protein
MVSCTGRIAASIGLNCENPLVGGYTGRALLIPVDNVIITDTPGEEPDKIYIELVDHHANAYNPVTWGDDLLVVAVDNIMMISPFDGSQTAGNADDGFAKFTKAFVFRIPDRGGKLSKDVIEPLVLDGRFIAILEKEQKVADGGFEFVGLQDALKCIDPSTVTRQEYANGGAWSVGLQCSEFSAETIMTHRGDYTSEKAKFDSLWEIAL